MTTKKSNLVNVGRITTVFGVKGWVKIHSHTEPRENILQYQPWWLKTRHGVKAVEIDGGKLHGQGIVAHIKGVDDRDQAREYCQLDIAVERDQLPALESDEFYWHELEGLTVISEFGDSDCVLGKVTKLIETGANDVLVVKGDSDSLDQKERLIPYVPEQFIKSIDLENGEIRVDWDPEF